MSRLMHGACNINVIIYLTAPQQCNTCIENSLANTVHTTI